MSKILKVNQGDYYVQVRSGGNITLDTGAATGEVRITGNLIVSGEYTTLDVANMQIEDNIIVLNKGESGFGITEGVAGIQISRGGHVAQPDAQLIFDESITSYDPVTNSELAGTWVFRNVNNQLLGLSVRSIIADGSNDFAIDMKGSSTTVFKLANVDATSYANLLLAADPSGYHNNDLTTKKYVSSYVAASNGVADVDRIRYSSGGTEYSKVQTYSTTIDFLLNSSVSARIDSAGLHVNHVTIFNDTVSNTSSNPLTFTSNTKSVEIDATVSLINQSSTPSSVAGKNKIYSTSTIGAGRTGLYFTNTTTSGELIAKNRALLLSMLF